MINVVTDWRRQTGFRLRHIGQGFGIYRGLAVVAGGKCIDDAGLGVEMAGERDRVGEGTEVIAPGEDIGPP